MVVTELRLSDLIADPQKVDANRIKRAFNPLEVIDITGFAVEGVTILVNLTERLTKGTNLLDQDHSKSMLRSTIWLNKVLKTIHYTHTHNLKFSDIRNQGSLRMTPPVKLPEGYLSSSLIPHEAERLGWSHDSKQINTQMFLHSLFVYEGKITSIRNEIQNRTAFTGFLIQAGMYKKDIEWLRKHLMEVPDSISVNPVPEYSPQLRYPYYNTYATITPVPSHIVQKRLHISLNGKPRIRDTLYFQRSSTVGDLVSCLGGRINILKKVPEYLGSHHSNLSSVDYDAELPRIITQLLKPKNFLLPINKRNQVRTDLEVLCSEHLSNWVNGQRLKNTPLNTKIERFHAYLSKSKHYSDYAYSMRLTSMLEKLFEVPSKAAFSQKSDYYYLVLPELSVSSANALSSAYSAGFPSVIGVSGFLHALQRKLLRLTDKPIEFRSFALCTHAFSYQSRGFTREHVLENHKVGTKDYASKSPAILPTRQADFKISIVIKTNKVSVDPSMVAASIPLKLTDGAVHLGIRHLSLVKSYTNFEDAIDSIPCKKGKWIVDGSSTHQFDSLEGFVDIIHSQKQVLPVCAGYQLLEIPNSKESLHDPEYKHAYAEPILSLALTRRYSKHLSQETFFWKYSCKDNYILVESESNAL